MDQNDTARIAALLEQIRDNQAAQLARQAEALAIVLPVVILLIIYLSWLLFR